MLHRNCSLFITRCFSAIEIHGGSGEKGLPRKCGSSERGSPALFGAEEPLRIEKRRKSEGKRKKRTGKRGKDTRMRENIIWAALHKIWGAGKESDRLLRALPQCVEGSVLWEMPEAELSRQFPQVPQARWQQFVSRRKEIDLSQAEAYFLQNQIQILLYSDPAYPALLREIHQPPAILYCRGVLPAAELRIAVVGSRKADAYGLAAAKSLSGALSAAGVPVVSGLARGIDAQAHWGALEGAAGTIAVQGCGMDQIYPRSNRALAREILSHGNSCILSELPLGSPPLGWHFPLRNRIISGLCRGVLLVQATEKSGAFSTVETALTEGRDVFAVPGEIQNPLSAGPHRILQEGAKLVAKAEDILQEYGVELTPALDAAEPARTADQAEQAPQSAPAQAPPQPASAVPARAPIPLTETEARLLECITVEPISIEMLSLLSHLPMAELMPALSMLELYGYVQQLLGRNYIRVG